MRLIEMEKTGRFVNVIIREANDVATAVEVVRCAQESDDCFDVILMDFIMVCVVGSSAYR